MNYNTLFVPSITQQKKNNNKFLYIQVACAPFLLAYITCTTQNLLLFQLLIPTEYKRDYRYLCENKTFWVDARVEQLQSNCSKATVSSNRNTDTPPIIIILCFIYLFFFWINDQLPGSNRHNRCRASHDFICVWDLSGLLQGCFALISNVGKGVG